MSDVGTGVFAKRRDELVFFFTLYLLKIYIQKFKELKM